MKNLNVNFILNADSYKNNHEGMLKAGLVSFESNIIPRKPSKYATHITVVGMQYFLKMYLDIRITMEDIDEAEEEITAMGMTFDRSRWEYIVEKYDGKIPLQIRAVPEGTVVPVGCPVARVISTDPKVLFLVSYIETQIQRGVWFPSTVASNARSIKEVLQETMLRHAGHKNVAFHLHNFGDRGASSNESAILAGMAHAVYFDGSDCMQANRNIKHWYNTKTNYLSSVDATEHSVTCSNSDAENRDDFNMAIKAVRLWEQKVLSSAAVKVLSVVIDTYDAYRFTREYIGSKLKRTIQEIGASGGRLVLRPDSGNAVTMPIEIIEILMEKFGYTVNQFGYRVLPSYIGVIQGDGINEDSIREIIALLDEKKISLENIVFGMGGKLVHPPKGRDTYSFAMKGTSQTTENGIEEDLFKDPITDVGKQSLKGKVTTFKCKQSGKIFHDRISLLDVNPFIEDMMVDVYVNGVLMNESTFDEVRERANKGL